MDVFSFDEAALILGVDGVGSSVNGNDVAVGFGDLVSFAELSAVVIDVLFAVDGVDVGGVGSLAAVGGHGSCTVECLFFACLSF